MLALAQNIHLTSKKVWLRKLEKKLYFLEFLLVVLYFYESICLKLASTIHD